MDRINIRKIYNKIQIDMIESAKASFSPVQIYLVLIIKIINILVIQKLIQRSFSIEWKM